jgi:hypothetical protein
MKLRRSNSMRLRLAGPGRIRLDYGVGSGSPPGPGGGGSTPTDPGAPDGVITIIEPLNRQTYQEKDGYFDAPISGSFTGGATQIEARAVPPGTAIDSTAYAWSPVPTNAAAKTFSGKVRVPQNGQFRVWQVRVQGNAATNATGTKIFGVGTAMLAIGQSNMVNAASTYSKTPLGGPLASNFNGSAFTRLGNYNDAFPPNTYIGSGGYSTFKNEGPRGDFQVLIVNEAIAELGAPVCIINKAVGGSSINDWETADTNWKNMATALTAAGGDCELAIWIQGETDANSMTAATRVTKLNALLGQLQTLTGRNATNFTLCVVAIGPGPYNGSSDGEFGTIRAADAQWARTTPGAMLLACAHDGFTNTGGAGTDTVHWNGETFNRVGLRAATALRAFLRDGTRLEGPRITAASRAGTRVTFTVAHSGGTALQDGAGGAGAALTGYQFFDDGAAGAEIAYSDTAIVGNTIQMTLASLPVGGLRAAYGLMNAPHSPGNDPRNGSNYASAVYDNVPVLKSTVGMLLQPLAPITVTGP